MSGDSPGGDSMPDPRSPEVAHLRVWIHPGSRTESVVWDEWRKAWAVSVRDPPHQGAANRGVERYLASILDLPRSSVAVVSGARSPAKSVRIEGLAPSVVEARLRRFSSPTPPRAVGSGPVQRG